MSTTLPTGDPRDINPGWSGYSNASPALIAGNGLTISSSSSWQTVELNLDSSKEFREMRSRVEDIEKRLAILRPNEDLQKRFPALQEAYDHYKLIEKLVNDQAKIHE